MRIKRKIGELGMSLGGSLLLKRKGKSVILCGTAGAGFPVALGALYTRAGVRGLQPRTLPVVFYWPVKAEPSRKRKGILNGVAENPANLVER